MISSFHNQSSVILYFSLSAQIVTGQKDAMDCVVHLMGLGLVTRPMAFLNNHLVGLDAVSTYCYVQHSTVQCSTVRGVQYSEVKFDM